MPLWSAALLAACFALPGAAAPAAVQPQTGRCTGAAGTETPPTGGAPVDLKARPDLQKLLPQLALLGYTPDANGTGRILSRDGAPLTDAAASWLLAPADFSHEKPRVDYWVWLTQQYRLDEVSCAMRDQSGASLSRLVYDAGVEDYRQQLRQSALEHLEARLSGLKAAAPVPAGVRRDMTELQKAGMTLPGSVRRVLGERRARVGELARATSAAYADSTRFFDGQHSLSDFERAAQPPVEGVTVKRLPSYFEPEEKRLGDLMDADLRERFSRTDAGRDLLDHLRDRDGRVELPPILLQKLSQRPSESLALAVYTDTNRSATMNYWTAMQSLLEVLPPGERAARAKELSDPGKLRQFLEAHPAEREQLLDRIDDIFYHEFIHAWQARRDGMGVENLRGNVGSAYPVEWEQEAFREQCRYILTKAMADPLSLTHAYGGPDFCLGMLKNFDGFDDAVRLAYQSQSQRAGGAETLPTIHALQLQRESMARRLMNDNSLFERAAQALKLKGMLRGDEAVKDLQLGDAQRRRLFITERLPNLRRRVAEALPHAYLELKRPDLALRVLAYLPPSTPGISARMQEAYAAVRPLLLKPPKSFALADRIAAYGPLMPFFNPDPPELLGAYWRDAGLEIAALHAQTESAPDLATRRALENGAETWRKMLANEDRQVAQLKQRALAMRDAASKQANLDLAQELAAALALAHRLAGGR